MNGRLAHGRTMSAAIVLLLAAVGPAPTVPAPALLAQQPSRALADVRDLAAGKLLVARRGLRDGNFDESVVLLLTYSAKIGAAGLIVNRRTTIPMRRAVPDLPMPSGPEPVLFEGGPVLPNEVRGLLRLPMPGFDAPRILPDVALLATPSAIEEAISNGAIADRLRIFSGYAGWSPGQLEREVVRGDWYIGAGDSKVVFAPDPGAVWRELSRFVDAVAL